MSKKNLNDQLMNDVAHKLFNKPYELLAIGETKDVLDYIDDFEHPKWKPVKTSYGDLVEVSALGEVRNVETKEKYSVYEPKNHYAYVFIGYPQTVHRLVATAFVPNDDPETKIEVNHIDGDKSNNWYRNLEWVTRSENKVHAVRLGLSPLGEARRNSKYSNAQIHYACQLLQDHPDWTRERIAKESGISIQAVERIITGESWKHISKNYDIKERDTRVRGEQSPNTIYTTEQIRHVCQLLQDHPELSYDEIGKITNVSTKVVGRVSRGETWKDVSKYYDIQGRKMN